MNAHFLAGLIIGACVVPVCAHSQEPPARASSAARQQPWLGCWEIHNYDSLPFYQREYVVRLDTAWITGRDEARLYRAWGLTGFRDVPNWFVGWSPGRGPDSIRVVLLGAGGIGWRLGRSGDSLVGRVYAYSDAFAGESILGAASAHRTACPR